MSSDMVHAKLTLRRIMSELWLCEEKILFTRVGARAEYCMSNKYPEVLGHTFHRFAKAEIPYVDHPKHDSRQSFE